MKRDDVVEKVDGGDAGENDGGGSGEALHDVVGVLDDDGDEKTPKGLEHHDEPHEVVVTKEKPCERRERELSLL